MISYLLFMVRYANTMILTPKIHSGRGTRFDVVGAGEVWTCPGGALVVVRVLVGYCVTCVPVTVPDMFATAADLPFCAGR
jgi:hypothetical protein